MQQGDFIIEVNRKPVTNIKEYDQAVSKIKKDETVLLLMKLQGEQSL